MQQSICAGCSKLPRGQCQRDQEECTDADKDQSPATNHFEYPC